jgi:aryl-alcohol dehydrogenase-like predicted oxidoreductase
MEYRQLGRSGLRFSELILGTMGFGGSGKFLDVGTTDVEDRARLPSSPSGGARAGAERVV